MGRDTGFSLAFSFCSEPSESLLLNQGITLQEKNVLQSSKNTSRVDGWVCPDNEECPLPATFLPLGTKGGQKHQLTQVGSHM